ncbi:F-box only protein 21 [Cytospora mali]|uniref:F-box only protein 21 n=1 Tax=Cytospora mali TaxID=578113 RepID=A0A194UVH9_CYTMA|nr:F-box only protein 21 [Valsa mali var. pyri (nom. inval.)]
MKSLPSLLQLPDELLDCIISQLVTPTDTVYFGLTCRRTHNLVRASLVWRRHCLSTWQYWTPRHDLPAKLAQPPLHTDWRQLCTERIRIDRKAAGLFEALLLSQQHRTQRMQEIAAGGRDVQDLLLRLKDGTPDEAEDVLARRWHAEAILGMVHRTAATATWRRLQRDREVSLEEALCAFDMFLLAADRVELVGDVKAELDRIAECVRGTADVFEELSTRQRALRIAEYLVSEGLVGNPDTANYHALRNNFISIALFSEEHTSLPLQSVAIYCAVAKRLGVDARPSNVPGHVLAVVTAPLGQSLDGGPKDASDDLERMHMDPWRQTQEITSDELSLRLLHAGIPPYQHSIFISGADTLEMILRTSRNILRSVEGARFGAPSQLDTEAAQYSAAWAMFILGDSNPALATMQRLQCWDFLLEKFHTHFPHDSALVTENMLPMLENLAEHHHVSEVLERMQEEDRVPKAQKRRDANNSGAQFRIGHYFHHKRYGYRGFVVGWDPHCAAGQAWIMRMGVDELPRGREQPFYNIVGEDRSRRYVAEENIERLNERPPQDMLRLGGQFFKRWDDEEGKFVSNICDEYPDD